MAKKVQVVSAIQSKGVSFKKKWMIISEKCSDEQRIKKQVQIGFVIK